ncbi:uncharacterized protein LOC120013847 [Tripterygium wilfordii]|uniref:uncharacterized protein LOC120013847 n=1 Tax=Tripterygium wilfordii TaxID=458696 RepID=UPI0018F804D7|nr:uncharacterized protein LOC120013847 [Tripterygium wilfordii]XP_038721734.1 uncharacterized protein LOC120013847 [Tripterygium wilfordii]
MSNQMHVQRKSEQNKKIRSKQTLLHTAGTKSFARVAAEMTKIDGVAPSRAKLFIKTHTRKDGSILTEDTREKIQKIEEKITQDPNVGISNEDDIGWSKDDVYSEVYGDERNGRVRSLGHGPTPSQKNCYVPRSLKGVSIISSSTSSRQSAQVMELTDRLASLEDKFTRFMDAFQSYAVRHGESSEHVVTPETHLRSSSSSHDPVNQVARRN